MVPVRIQFCAAPAVPRSDGEAKAEAPAEDDVEADGRQLGFLTGGERREGAARFRSRLGEDEGPGIGEAGRQNAMLLVVGLAC